MRSRSPARWSKTVQLVRPLWVAVAVAITVAITVAGPFDAAAQKQRSRTEQRRAEDEAPETNEGDLDAGPRYKKSDANTDVPKNARVIDQVAVVIETTSSRSRICASARAPMAAACSTRWPRPPSRPSAKKRSRACST